MSSSPFADWIRNSDGSTGEAWNPSLGCDCGSCYLAPVLRQTNGDADAAPAYAGLTRTGDDGEVTWTGRINLLDARLTIPLERHKPTTWWVNSMGEVFHNGVPDDFIASMFAVMAVAGQHTFVVVTKLYERMQHLLTSPTFRHHVHSNVDALSGGGMRAPELRWPLPNLRVGVCAEDQDTAEPAIAALLDTAAFTRLLYAAPLLGPINLRRVPGALGSAGLDWIVTAGEYGPRARPSHIDWFRMLRNQATDAKVPFLFRGWGTYRAVELFTSSAFPTGWAFRHPSSGVAAAVMREPGRGGQMRRLRAGDKRRDGSIMLDDNTLALRMGRRDAGHELDGETWQQYPGYGSF
ncbi:DUF5131 family protein [Actinoplanes sp. URMC 104]|uniref:DUF5131 family protein n=1 Tax=Actinoplanes sp. URMC 104 TaxID=3423409 RepID=UPI003F19ACCC